MTKIQPHTKSHKFHQLNISKLCQLIVLA